VLGGSGRGRNVLRGRPKLAKVDVEPERLEDEELALDIPAEIIGRSPGQIFWRRFRKDRFAIVGVVMIVVIISLALLAPVFAKLMNHPPDQSYVREMTTTFPVTGLPMGPTLHNSAGV